jgi:hypothetical protein
MKASLSITCLLLLPPILFFGPACSVEKPVPASPVQGASGQPDVRSPEPGQEVATPLTVEGSAPGTWFFEGSFPVRLLNRAGEVIGQGNASAKETWMTEKRVPFTAELTFSVSERQQGKLVLEKANPSGRAGKAERLEIPLQLRPSSGAVTAAKEALADRLGIASTAVETVSKERVEWPDACLGLDTGQMCAMVITPGYRIVLEAEGKRYEYRTDLSGGTVMSGE